MAPQLSFYGSSGIVGRSIAIHEKAIELNHFPDIYGIPLVPTINGAPFQREEENVGPIIACGIITFTDSNVAAAPAADAPAA